ncbi:hypothetical protein SAMN02745166_04299 [Prosthecobacter debontii]|uniref:Uncharacterized protein n=1 Tax=Prosthecobacter debontii TaxID=48467 RepID=A0A1T4YUK7_9BACT|nr:hypothetical protein SAMN02745166_04299 [Prosthecobacter debontii]
MLGARGRLARVDVFEEEGPAALVDVVFELLAGQAADADPLLRGEFQSVKLTDGKGGPGKGTPVASGEVARSGLVGLAEVGGQIVDKPSMMLDGLEFAGGGTQVLVAVVTEGIPALSDPGADLSQCPRDDRGTDHRQWGRCKCAAGSAGYGVPWRRS